MDYDDSVRKQYVDMSRVSGKNRWDNQYTIIQEMASSMIHQPHPPVYNYYHSSPDAALLLPVITQNVFPN